MTLVVRKIQYNFSLCVIQGRRRHFNHSLFAQCEQKLCFAHTATELFKRKIDKTWEKMIDDLLMMP